MASRVRRVVSVRACAAWLAAVALVGAALLAWWLPTPQVGAAPTSSASSADSIQIDEPQSFQGKYGGPMGTQVSLALLPPPSQTAQTQEYQLGVVTSPPSASTCASAIDVAGLGPVQINWGGNLGGQEVTFTWPSQMGTGTFWFCATPVGGSGATIFSPAAESLTITTVNPPQVAVAQPTTLQAGGQISVTVTGWFTSDGQTPQLALTQSSPNSGLNYPLTATAVSAPQGMGQYTIFSNLPANLPGGNYTVTATGECGPSPDGASTVCAVTEVSPAFPILAAPTPQPIATHTVATGAAAPSGHASGSDSIGDVLPILAAEGAAALILFVIFANLVVRQRRRARARALTAWRTWERSPEESDHFRVEPLPKRPKR